MLGGVGKRRTSLLVAYQLSKASGTDPADAAEQRVQNFPALPLELNKTKAGGYGRSVPEKPEIIATSKNGVPIRLPEERWLHIVEEHSELGALRAEVLRTIADPERIVAGNTGELLALRTQADQKVLVAIYREIADDGFVITAFLTRRLSSLNRRPQQWPPPKLPNS